MSRRSSSSSLLLVESSSNLHRIFIESSSNRHYSFILLFYFCIMNLRDHKIFLGELQGIWGSYKVGGSVWLRVYFTEDGSVKWAAALNVTNKTFRCVDWVYGSTPNDLTAKLIAWIVKDESKHLYSLWLPA